MFKIVLFNIKSFYSLIAYNNYFTRVIPKCSYLESFSFHEILYQSAKVGSKTGVISRFRKK